MSADPSRTPELEPLALSPEHQARVDAARSQAEASHAEGMGKVLADAQAASRRLAAAADMPNVPADLYGEFCVECKERWALPADKATCGHRPICEDCWPNGCPECIADVEAEVQHRESVTRRITTAALELRTGADDLNDTDLPSLDWRDRGDILRHVELTIESLRRVRDVINAGNRKAAGG